MNNTHLDEIFGPHLLVHFETAYFRSALTETAMLSCHRQTHRQLQKQGARFGEKSNGNFYGKNYNCNLNCDFKKSRVGVLICRAAQFDDIK